MFEAPSTIVLDDINTFADGAIVQSYVSMAIMALVLYDHIITLGMELDFVWRRKPSKMTILFALNRYSVLAYGIIDLLSDYRRGCSALILATQVLSILLMVLFAVCSAVRVYALGPWRITMALLVFSLDMIQVGVNIFLFSMSQAATTDLPFAGCISVLPLSNQLRNKYATVIAARLPTILADAIVLAVTLRKTWRTYATAADVNMRTPFASTLIRDGTVYFLSSLVMNLAEVLVYHSLGQVYLLPFICSLTGILFTRLFFDLRELGQAESIAQLGFSEFEASEYNMIPMAFATTNDERTLACLESGSELLDRKDSVKEMPREGSRLV